MTISIMNQIKAYSYIRFSTLQQQHGNSYKRQLEFSIEYANKRGFILDETLTYKDLGVSAFDKSNVRDGQLGVFLKAVEAGLVPVGSFLLVESLDRISRAAITDALKIFLSIVDNGITLVTLADGMEYSKEKINSQFSDIIISIAIMSRAHEESLMKSKRLKAAWLAKLANISIKKLTATGPSWLELNNEKTEYLLIPEKVKLVQDIFEWTKIGIGTGTITKRLNQGNVPHFTKRAKMWYDSYLQKILHNRAVIGEFQPHHMVEGKRVPVGEPIADYFPRIISDELFNLAHASRKSRLTHGRGRKGKGISNLFSGILRCGYCQGSIIHMNKGHIGPRGKLLVCANAKAGKKCIYVPWEYDYFEKSVLTYCQGLDLEVFLQEHNNIESERITLEGKIEVLKSAILLIKQKESNILEAIEDGAKYLQFASRSEKLSNECSKAEVELQYMQTQYDQLLRKNFDTDAVRSNIKEFIAQMNKKSGDELHDLRSALSAQIKKILHRIVIYPKGYIDNPKYIERLRKYLLEKGFSPSDVEQQILKEIAKTQGADKRFFTMASFAGAIKVIQPSSENPETLHLDANSSSFKENMELHVDSIKSFVDLVAKNLPKK